MHVGTSGVSALPDRFTSKQGFVALERDFPEATTDPVEIVVAQGADSPVAQALDGLRRELAAIRGSAGRDPTSADGAVAVLSVPVQGDPSSDAAVAAVRELRSETSPHASPGSDAEVLVGGTTSENIDYFDSVIDPAPCGDRASCSALTFVLLTVVFRSVVVAGTAVVPQPALGRRRLRTAGARLPGGCRR